MLKARGFHRWNLCQIYFHHGGKEMKQLSLGRSLKRYLCEVLFLLFCPIFSCLLSVSNSHAWWSFEDLGSSVHHQISDKAFWPRQFAACQ